MNNELTVDGFALDLVPEEAIAPVEEHPTKQGWSRHVFADSADNAN